MTATVPSERFYNPTFTAQYFFLTNALNTVYAGEVPTDWELHLQGQQNEAAGGGEHAGNLALTNTVEILPDYPDEPIVAGDYEIPYIGSTAVFCGLFHATTGTICEPLALRNSSADSRYKKLALPLATYARLFHTTEFSSQLAAPVITATIGHADYRTIGDTIAAIRQSRPDYRVFCTIPLTDEHGGARPVFLVSATAEKITVCGPPRYDGTSLQTLSAAEAQERWVTSEPTLILAAQKPTGARKFSFGATQ
jgi:hypothetical protein